MEINFELDTIKGAKLVLWGFVLSALFIIIFSFLGLEGLATFSIFLLPFYFGFMLWVSYCFFKGTKVKATLDLLLMIIGTAYILGINILYLNSYLGNISFTVTVCGCGHVSYYSSIPIDNPIVDAILLNFRGPVSMVYSYAILGFLSIGFCGSMLWIGFVRYKQDLIDSLRHEKNKDLLDYLGAAIGIKRRSEWVVNVALLCIVVIIGGVHFGLWANWLWIVPSHHDDNDIGLFFVTFIGLAVFLSGYFFWLLWHYLRFIDPVDTIFDEHKSIEELLLTDTNFKALWEKMPPEVQDKLEKNSVKELRKYYFDLLLVKRKFVKQVIICALAAGFMGLLSGLFIVPDIILGALAGYILSKKQGGIFWGILLFLCEYLVAFAFKQTMGWTYIYYLPLSIVPWVGGILLAVGFGRYIGDRIEMDSTN